MFGTLEEVKQLRDNIQEFFTNRTVTPISNQNCDSAGNYFHEKSCEMSLLRIVCMGNAERTVQGELITFLRGKKWFAVSEASFRTTKNLARIDRHIDIMVFSPTTTFPIAAIELKHHSANQSSIDSLLKGMDEDYDKARRVPIKGKNKVLPASLTLIQIGIFTEVTSVTQPPGKTLIDLTNCPAAEFYRFLLAYTAPNQIINANHYGIKNPQSTLASKTNCAIIVGTGQCFQIKNPPATYEIAGKVHILIHTSPGGTPSTPNGNVVSAALAQDCRQTGFT